MFAHDVLDERLMGRGPVAPGEVEPQMAACRGTGRSARACQLALSAKSGPPNVPHKAVARAHFADVIGPYYHHICGTAFQPWVTDQPDSLEFPHYT